MCKYKTQEKKSQSGGLLFSNGWSVKKVPHFLNVQLRTVKMLSLQFSYTYLFVNG